MSDLIRVVDLEVLAHIGVPEAERSTAQRLFISLEMSTESFSHAAKTDDLARTINYDAVVQRVKSLTTKHPRKLLETLAEEISHDLFKAFPIKKITLEIKKFVLPDVRYVSVKIERTNPAS